MNTKWGDIASKVQDTLKSALPYAKITTIGSVEEYLMNNVSQALLGDISVLIGPPRGASYMPSNQPKLSGVFRRKYEFEIVVIAKNDPAMVGRLVGANSKIGIDQALVDVYNALEHKNLGGFVDNKAGTNFEGAFEKQPQEDKAVTIFTTIYTVIKTER